MKKRTKFIILGVIIALLAGTVVFARGEYGQGFMRIPENMNSKIFRHKIDYNRLKNARNLIYPDLYIEDLRIETHYENPETGYFMPTAAVFSICNKGGGTYKGDIRFDSQSKKYHFDQVDEVVLKYNECHETTISGYFLVGNYDKNNLGYGVIITVDPEDLINELDEENNSSSLTFQMPYCGDNICTEFESHDFCPFDCAKPCDPEHPDWCNSDVVVTDACENIDFYASKMACVKAGVCDKPIDYGVYEQFTYEMVEQETNCSGENYEEELALFDDYNTIQTIATTCLDEYFEADHQPINHVVFNNLNTIACQSEEGCVIYGGVNSLGYILSHHLSGFRLFGKNHPTEPEHIKPDTHETTHYIIQQTLHAVPRWYNEAMAFNSAERLGCGIKALEEMGVTSGPVYDQEMMGDAWLREAAGDDPNYWGVMMDDGTFLNENFYTRLKNGETSLSEEEQQNPYPNGALWLMGLKLDYSCTEDCLKDIYQWLYTYEQTNCDAGTNCGVNFLGQFTPYINTATIKQATTAVLGVDTSPLFDLLYLEETENVSFE